MLRLKSVQLQLSNHLPHPIRIQKNRSRRILRIAILFPYHQKRIFLLDEGSGTLQDAPVIHKEI
jgi:hypothetical protein